MANDELAGLPDRRPSRECPFRADEQVAILAAYEALTRLGNRTRDEAVHGDPDGWDPMLDAAHQKLGVLIAVSHLDRLAGLPDALPGGHTGQVTVRVYPIGRPGFVRYEVADDGPTMLDQAVMARLLAGAADFVLTGSAANMNPEEEQP